MSVYLSHLDIEPSTLKTYFDESNEYYNFLNSLDLNQFTRTLRKINGNDLYLKNSQINIDLFWEPSSDHKYLAGYLYIQDLNNTKYYISYNGRYHLSEITLSDSQIVTLRNISLTTEKKEIMYIYFDNTSVTRNKFTFRASGTKINIFASNDASELGFDRDMNTYRLATYNEFDLTRADYIFSESKCQRRHKCNYTASGESEVWFAQIQIVSQKVQV